VSCDSLLSFLLLLALLAVQLLLKHGDYPTPKKKTAGKAAPFIF
jgi:hypothetical protein